jgi:hypothetical protein
VWLPIPSIDSSYQQSLESTWTGNARSMQQTADARYGAKMLVAEFAEGRHAGVELTSRFRTQNRAQDWSPEGGRQGRPGHAEILDRRPPT